MFFCGEWPDLTDEEYQTEIDKEGLTGQVTPEQLRDIIRKNMYDKFQELVQKNVI